MNQTTKNVLNPRSSTGGYFAPHALLLAAIIAGILALAGVFAVTHNAAFFEKTYPKLGLRVPAKTVEQVGAIRLHVPAAASIDLARFPAVENQSTIGACAAFSTGEVIDYLYRTLHPGHPGIRFSPRYLYSRYGETYSNGQDAGSWPDQLIAPIATSGIPQWKIFSYPPYIVDPSIPYAVQQAALKHKLHVTANDLVVNGSGQAIVDALRSVISQGRPAVLAINVPPSFDNATQTGGLVYGPAGQQSRGGHAIVALAYNDAMRMPDGSVGAVLTQNQWSTAWANHGRAWISYNWLNSYGIGVVDLQLAGSPMAQPPISKHVVSLKPVGIAPGVKKPPFVGGIRPLVPPPPSARTSRHPKPTAGVWYVRGVYATDRSLDLSPIINAAADRYGIAPYGLAATIASECGLKTGVNGDCNRFGYGNDVSFGACQITVGTAAGYGVGDGSYSYANEQAVENFEDNPYDCIPLAAHILSDYSRYRGGAGYEGLNILWNCGPATTSWPTPYGECATNFYGDFDPWFRFSLSHWAVGYNPAPVPKPRKPFNWSLWNHYRLSHHERVISPLWHGRTSWAAAVWYQGHEWLGGIAHKDVWYGPTKERHEGFSKVRFAHGCIFSWPKLHAAKVQRHPC
jgi:hypothetical protein